MGKLKKCPIVLCQVAIVFLWLFSKCDIDKYDNKLKVKNNLNYDIAVYINSDWPDTTIGNVMQTIGAHDDNGVPLPMDWEKYIIEKDTVTLLFTDIKYSKTSKEVAEENVIKRIFATEHYLDSINWIIIVP